MTVSRHASFDPLVGEREQSVRHGEAERFDGLQIDDKFEFRRLHDRQVARFLAFDNTAGVNPGLTKRVASVGAVAHQPAIRNEFAPNVTGGNRMASRQRDELSRRSSKNGAAATRSAPMCCRSMGPKAVSKSLSGPASRTGICRP